jgi:SAM-dependent methyltransferase
MRRWRLASYGEDIGQHSWVSAEEMRSDIQRLNLTQSCRFLDLGCGPCGPLTFVLDAVQCPGAGIDASLPALRAGRRRAESLGIGSLLTVQAADLNRSLPFKSCSFDRAISLDVVLHLRDRLNFFEEIARVLSPGGRFLFTDAGVITGPVSSEEVRKRSAHGFTQFVPPGWNERLLEIVGFELIEIENRTGSVVKNAAGRLAAMRVYRDELLQVLGMDAFEKQQEYLQIVIELSHREALSRVMYLAEVCRSAAV